MHQDPERDLNELCELLNQDIRAIRAIITDQNKKDNSKPQNQTNQQQNSIAIARLEKNISNFKKYSQYLLQFGENSRSELLATKKELAESKKSIRRHVNKLLTLEEESLILRKRLNEKEREIQKLKILNKIDVSYVSSFEVQRSSSTDSDSPISEVSISSVASNTELSLYNTSNNDSAEAEHEEGLHCIDQQFDENFERLMIKLEEMALTELLKVE